MNNSTGEESSNTVVTGDLTVPELEYTGLIEGLKFITALNDVQSVKIIGDSKIVINQLKRVWECKATNLRVLRSDAWNLLGKVKEWSADWTPREFNSAG